MMPQWLIERKRDGRSLTAEEITSFVDGYTKGAIPDYQMSAFAMAVYFQGMNEDEVAALTRAMMHSGELPDMTGAPGPRADKHSTGGIGDKVSLILAPLMAVCGVKVPMISGRGLGITGGTLDKLESIPGFRTQLGLPEFLDVLNECGCAMIGQTPQLVPADRKLYALRDVTATVPSIPLITASILSKKLAEGLDALVLDVKFGRGAFMRTEAEARRLAESLVATGRRLRLKVCALLTAMNQPLGRTAGNALEVVESVEALQGQGPADLMELTYALGAEMLVMTGRCATHEEAAAFQRKQIESGAAFACFKRLVARQGGDAAALDDPAARLPSADIRQPLSSPGAGCVAEVDAERIGRACLVLGAGRTQTGDRVDPAVGVSALVKVGDVVRKGDILALVHANEERRLDEARPFLREAFVLSAQPVQPPPLIRGRVE